MFDAKSFSLVIGDYGSFSLVQQSFSQTGPTDSIAAATHHSL